MAIAIPLERIQRLPQCDKDDLFEAAKGLSNTDPEEVENAVVTTREILEQRPGRIRRMESPDESSGRAPELNEWIAYVSRRIVETRSAAGLTQT